jgi:hypothetical protein
LGCVFHFWIFISTGKYVNNGWRSYDLFCKSDWTVSKWIFPGYYLSRFHKVRLQPLSWLWSLIVWEYKTRTWVKPIKTVLCIIYIGFTETKKVWLLWERQSQNCMSCSQEIFVKKTWHTENLWVSKSLCEKKYWFLLKYNHCLSYYFFCNISEL